MGIIHKLTDGSVEIRESFDISPLSEDDRNIFVASICEAADEHKRTKLVARIAAMQEGMTRNKTIYSIEELEASVPTWTSPYPCPVIKDHNEWEIDDIVGRIKEAFIAPDGEVNALWFEVAIMTPEAQENVASGLWNQVSIGTRVSHAICNVCGNDWAKGTWCDHERGSFYLKDEDDPTSVMECGWILTGLAGREVSFVTTPSAPLAGVRDTKTEEAEAAEIVSFERMALIEQTKEDDKLMAAVESAVLSEKTGSPVIVKDDESNVPSEKEEGDVTKNARLTDEEEAAKAATKSEVEESSDATPEGEESTTETDETEDADLDGTAETETEDEEVDKTAESDDSTTESDEEVSDGADLSSDGADNGSESESDEDLSESETEIEATDADDTTGEREELLVRVSELEAEVVSLKAELYVETGLADGILTGERDSLIEMHEGMAESSLDDLLGRLRERRSSVGSPSEKLRGLVKNDKATRTDDDKNADDKVTSGTTVSVRTEQGSHSVTVNDDDDTVITVTPKL